MFSLNISSSQVILKLSFILQSMSAVILQCAQIKIRLLFLSDQFGRKKNVYDNDNTAADVLGPNSL